MNTNVLEKFSFERRERYDKQWPPITDKTMCIKTRQIEKESSEDAFEVTTNSGLSGFQAVLIIGIHILHPEFTGSLEVALVLL